MTYRSKANKAVCLLVVRGVVFPVVFMLLMAEIIFIVGILVIIHLEAMLKKCQVVSKLRSLFF